MKLLSNSINSIAHRTYSTLKQFHSKQWNQPSGQDTNIKIFNPITKTEVPLVLKRKNTASWYMCGPTVYDSTPIGHGSCFVKQDIIQRILRKHFQINVVTAMNITDIDDKIIAQSHKTNEDWMLLTKRYEQEFWTDMQRLGIETPNISVRVTDHMPEIIQFTQTLLDRRMAYEHTDGSVYFDVQKCSTYCKFQPLNEQSKHEFKRSQFDFAVWKGAKPNEPSWNAPWGNGRPGWHVECSVLASLIFGQSLDFHSGGLDLRFPHHENEEAQCCSYHGTDQWVNYWIHTGQLHLVGESVKMSKPLNNVITVPEFLAKYTANEFRMLCLLSHYRHQMDYSDTHMDVARMACKKFNEFLSDIDACVKGQKSFSDLDSNELHDQMNEASIRMDGFLRDDFTTSRCIEQLMWLMKPVNNNSTAVDASSNSVNTEQIVNGVVDIRNRLRNRALESKDKQLLKDCDDIRDCFKLNGIVLKDHGKLSSWHFTK